MAGYMEKTTRTPSFGDFTEDERSLFAVAYNNFICSRRKAWRVVFSAENKEEGQRNTAIAALIKAYRPRIEAEISSICGEVFGLLNSHLIPSASSAESKVLYLKIKGDFHRYLAEFKVREERKQAAIDAAAAYHAAQIAGLWMMETLSASLVKYCFLFQRVFGYRSSFLGLGCGESVGLLPFCGIRLGFSGIPAIRLSAILVLVVVLIGFGFVILGFWLEEESKRRLSTGFSDLRRGFWIVLPLRSPAVTDPPPLT